MSIPSFEELRKQDTGRGLPSFDDMRKRGGYSKDLVNLAYDEYVSAVKDHGKVEETQVIARDDFPKLGAEHIKNWATIASAPPPEKTFLRKVRQPILEVPKSLMRFMERGVAKSLGGSIPDWIGQTIAQGGELLDEFSKIGSKDKNRIVNPLAEEIIASGNRISKEAKAAKENWARMARTGWEKLDPQLKKSNPAAYYTGEITEGVWSSALSVLAAYLSGGASAAGTLASQGMNINRGLVALSSLSAASGFDHAQREGENYIWSTINGLTDGLIEYTMESEFLSGVKTNMPITTAAMEGLEEGWTGFLQNTKNNLITNINKGMSTYKAAKKSAIDAIKSAPKEMLAGFIGGYGMAKPVDAMIRSAKAQNEASMRVEEELHREETITNAAIKMEDGKIFEGNSHPDIVMKLNAESDGVPSFEGSKMGFMTSEGRFVGRDEAAWIAGMPRGTKAESQELKKRKQQKEKGKPFKGTVYKGRAAGGSVDVGTIGKGTYYSTKKEIAESYGPVEETKVELKNPYYAKSEEEITKLAEDVAVEQDKKNADKPIDVRTELREEAVSNAIRKRLEAKGHDGIVLDRGKAGKEIVVFKTTKQQRLESLLGEVKGRVADKKAKRHAIRAEEIKARSKKHKEAEKAKAREHEHQNKFNKKMAHVMAKRLGYSGKHRRRLNYKLTGKRSMKDMSLEESAMVADQLRDEAKEAGLVSSTAEEIATNLEVAEPVDKAEIRGLDKKGFDAIKDRIKKASSIVTTSLARVERMTEYLDGKVKGLLYTNLWEPVTGSLAQAVDTSHKRVNEYIDEIERITKDKKGVERIATGKRAVVVEATDKHKAVKLSPTEKIAVYMFAQNEDGLRHLAEGNFSEFENAEDIVAEVSKSLTKEEKKIADWMLNDMNKQFSKVQQAARIALGRELTKQDNYFALYLRDLELDKQTDFLSSLERKMVPKEKGEISEVQERKKGARQPLRLDAFSNYIYHVNRVEHFVNMAPVASSVGDIINNKKIRRAINKKTHGVGIDVYDGWLRDAVRGVPTENSGHLSKALMILRRNGIVYAIGYSIPSAMRQQLSGFNTMAVHPTVATNYLRNITVGKKPANYQAMEKFAYENSIKLRTRNFDRVEYVISQQSSAKQKLLRKKPWSSKALSFIRYMDKHTTVYTWTALYDAAMNDVAAQKQFGLDGSHDAAVDFADKWVGRTQPMGGVEHLPDFYRGGALERILSAFQNQVNNNLNFWVNDIGIALKKGRINKTQAAYRIMMSYVLPAMAFGAIGRFGLPKSWKDVLFDLAVYPLGSIFLVGRIIYNGIMGFTGGSGVTSIGPSEVSKSISSAVEGDSVGVIKHGAKGVGALTGWVPAQFFRTGEGALDLVTGETKDLRRLIYSDWSLENYGLTKPKKEEDRYF